MRRVDKRKWACTNIQGECLMSQTTGAALCQEVPADRKCVLCQSDITILGEAIGSAHGIMEIVFEWQCESCRRTGSMETGIAPEKCPDCGGELFIPPVKKGEPFDPDTPKRY